MKSKATHMTFVLTALVVCLTIPGHAATNRVAVGSPSLLAYTDPGSGAMLWQLLLSSGVLAGFYFSRAKKWVSSVFKTRSVQAPPDQQ